MTNSSSPNGQASANTTRHNNIVLSIVVIGTLMGAVDVTIVLLAFPSITRSLHADFLTSIWIILAYLLVIAVTTTQPRETRRHLWSKQNVQLGLHHIHSGFCTLRLFRKRRVFDSFQGYAGYRWVNNAVKCRRNYRRRLPTE